jgi:HEAT repeat protein
VSLDKLASLATDESDSVRQLVATTLSRNADAKWTDTLIALVKDKEVEVAREAAVGLGKIGNDKATQPLVDALNRADKPSREKFLQALRDGIGANGLVLALKTVTHEKADSEKFQTKQIFDMLKDLQDPRGGDALYAYIQSNPKPHWKVEAAMRMAEIGDVRAAEVLGWRMMQDPLKLYNDVDWPEQRRDDNERVFGARMLADLAAIHPEKRDYLLKTAEPGMLFWVDPENKPQPHANGMRFLALVGSQKALPMLEKWADPKDKLPNEGAQPPFPDSWATAQSALRYVGWAKSPRGWQILEKQMHRRKKTLDVSWDSLMQGGLTILGMTLRALGVGSADGFAQWGDPKAYDDLVKYIEDPLENEQARMEGCFALSWVATDDQMKDVAKKILSNTKTDPKANLLRQCYLETLVHRPVADATGALVDQLAPSVPDIEVRHQMARAIGMGGITQPMVPQIFTKIADINVKADAALALVLGADADTAARAIATYNDASVPAEAMEELKDIYNKTFGYWSDRNYDSGDIARWVANAQAIAHVKVHDALQDWPRIILGRDLAESTEIDNGPHSMTKVQLRWKLMADARGKNDVKRAEAIAILKFIKEKGVLMALRGEPEPLGEMARQAFFEVMNPKSTAESIPESPKAAKDQGMPGLGGAKSMH